MKKDKRTTNDLQNPTQKTNDQATRTPLKIGFELRCPGRVSNSCFATRTSVYKVIYYYQIVKTKCIYYYQIVKTVLSISNGLVSHKSKPKLQFSGDKFAPTC
jgi:hypothetical protein